MPCTTTIDWAATGTMLQGIGSISGVVAVILAAWISANTFEKWRQQKLAERRIEQAERILTATYKVRRGLSHVRNIAMWAHELEAAEEQLKTSGEWEKFYSTLEQKNLAIAKSYYNRLAGTQDVQKSLEECQPMARALFSENLEKAIEKLNHQFWTVKVYVDANLRDKADADADFRRRIESAIWEGYPSPDKNEVDQIIAEQVKLIESVCVPVLRLEGTKSKRSKKKAEPPGPALSKSS